jgi:hypothetical protein
MLGSHKKHQKLRVWPLLSCIALTVILISGYLFFYHAPKAYAAWYNTNWNYRKLFTINDSEVSIPNGTTLSNFPVLVYITDPDLETVSNGGYVELSTGQDIIFTASNGTTLLNYEIVSYSATSGALQAWVNISSISPSGSYTFYMYYGDSTAPANTTSNAQGTWNSNYAAVFHLEQAGNGTAGEYTDSTSHGNGMQGGGGTSAKVPTLATGQITGGEYFNGNDYTVKNTPSGLPTVQSSQTFSCWYEVPSNPDSNENLVVTDNGSAGNQLRFSGVGDTIGMYQWGAGLTVAATAPPSAGQWAYVVWTHSGSANDLYINGVSVATSSTATQTGTPTELELGSYDTTPDEPLLGTIDEVHILTAAMTADWINTEYQNQLNPLDFYSEGAQAAQNEPPGVPTLINPAASATNISILPELTLSTTDDNSYYVDYQIELFSGASCGTLLTTITETSSTAGWLDEDENSAAAYSTGIVLQDSSVAKYQYSSANPALSPNTAYSWEAEAIDPGGDDTYSGYSACQSFTTAQSEVRINGGTDIRGGTTIQ